MNPDGASERAASAWHALSHHGDDIEAVQRSCYESGRIFGGAAKAFVPGKILFRRDDVGHGESRREEPQLRRRCDADLGNPVVRPVDQAAERERSQHLCSLRSRCFANEARVRRHQGEGEPGVPFDRPAKRKLDIAEFTKATPVKTPVEGVVGRPPQRVQ
jgi:hypothetical protein